MDPLGTPQPTKPASNPGPAQGLMTLNATKAETLNHEPPKPWQRNKPSATNDIRTSRNLNTQNSIARTPESSYAIHPYCVA